MRDRQARPQHRPVASVKDEQRRGRRVGEATMHQIKDPPGSRTPPQPGAFERQEGNLVERIIRPQARIEFQAIDRARRIAEPDMLGPQVAMAVDDVATFHPRHEKIATLGQETPLHAIDGAHQPSRQVEPRME
jgi:hypothetical protein